jgi:hypothetical protein
LIADPPADRATLERAATGAAWTLPRTVSVVAIAADHRGLRNRRLPADVLVGAADGIGCLVLPDPAGSGRRRQLETALDGMPAALGPAVAVDQGARSWSRARGLWRLLAGGRLGDGGLHAAEDHLLDLLLAEDPTLVDDLAALRLAPLRGLAPRSRERLEATLLAYLRHRGNGPRAAADLHVHPQTVRYRLGRLRELLGDALDDPDARFELEVVLRARGTARP